MKDVITKTDKTLGVFETYPTFSEIVSDPKYKYHLLVSPFEKSIVENSSDKWIHIVNVVDRMCEEMYGLKFFKSHFFQPTKDPFDFDSLQNIDGVGKVYCSRGDIHEVDYKTFIELTLVMYMSFLGIPLTDEQFNSYLDFKGSSTKVWTILD